MPRTLSPPGFLRPIAVSHSLRGCFTAWGSVAQFSVVGCDYSEAYEVIELAVVAFDNALAGEVCNSGLVGVGDPVEDGARLNE